MDQSKSSNTEEKKIALPKRSFSLEFFVGIFAIVGCLAAAYLAVGLGGLELGATDKYLIYADFDNISGLKNGASVEIAGVKIGDVTGVTLDDSTARVALRVDKNVQIRDDDMALIRTKGIIGDRYVKISRGMSDTYLKPGEVITETESVVDIEDLIGKIVHNMSGDKDEDEKKNDSAKPVEITE